MAEKPWLGSSQLWEISNIRCINSQTNLGNGKIFPFPAMCTCSHLFYFDHLYFPKRAIVSTSTPLAFLLVALTFLTQSDGVLFPIS